MKKTDLHVFEVPGCGRVIGDLNRDDLPPVIQFEDGVHCFGLPRKFEEVMPMGYESIAEGNFIHEALHMFVAHHCGFTRESILHRAGNGVDIDGDPAMLRDAQDEERLVLGLQIAVNDTEGDALTTNKVGGFLLHIAAAAREFSRAELKSRYDCDMDTIKGKFIEQLKESGCYRRVFARTPELRPNPPSGNVLPFGSKSGELQVGDRVQIVGGGHRVGRFGTLIDMDDTDMPYHVEFDVVDEAAGEVLGTFWYEADYVRRAA